MSKLRVGVIGLGVGLKHLEAYNRHPSCEVIGICDFDHLRLDSLPESTRDLAFTRQADALIQRSDIDLISIASYDNYHAAQIIAALDSGKHVMVEKPLCLTPQEFIDVQAAIARNPKAKLSSNLVLRTIPRFQWLREEIAAGHFGNVYFAEADYLWGRPHKLTGGWRPEMHYYSLVLGAAIHPVDLLLWLKPNEKVKRVFAVGNKMSLPQAQGFNSFAHITLEFSSGFVAKVSAHGASRMPHFHRVEVYGTQAAFVHEPDRALVYQSLDTKDKPQPVIAAYPGEQKSQVITSFVDHILNSSSKPLVSSEDALNSMAVCLAIDESMHAGKAVEIRSQQRKEEPAIAQEAL